MLTLRLPIDDRRQGLAEGPSRFVACTDAPQSEVDALDGCVLAANSGVLDAKAMQAQLEIACRYAAAVERVAARYGLLPSVIAGFCSRRSGWGLDLVSAGVEGTRDRQRRVATEERRSPLPPDGLGFSRGLMGLDYDRHPLARELHWRDPERNIDAAFALIADISTTLRRRTTLQGTGLLRASLAAFECGRGRVERAIRHGLDVDSPTVGWSQSVRGCGRDVLMRARFFQNEGWD